MDDASRKRFEEWCNNQGNQRIIPHGSYSQFQAWKACDTAWRKRLQSEEMVEKGKEALDCYMDDRADGTVEAAARAVINAILEDVNNPNKMNTSDERVQKVDTSDTLEGWLKAQIALPVNIGDDYQRGFDNALRACLARLRTAEPVSPQHGKDIPS